MSEDTLKELLDEYWKQSAKTKDVVLGIMNLRGHGDSRTSDDLSRPYPPGLAWDEARRERKRADRLERAMASVLEVTEGHVGSGPLNVIASIAVNALEGQYDE